MATRDGRLGGKRRNIRGNAGENASIQRSIGFLGVGSRRVAEPRAVGGERTSSWRRSGRGGEGRARKNRKIVQAEKSGGMGGTYRARLPNPNPLLRLSLPASPALLHPGSPPANHSRPLHLSAGLGLRAPQSLYHHHRVRHQTSHRGVLALLLLASVTVAMRQSR